MKVTCPECKHEFSPPRESRYVIIDGRALTHKLSTESSALQRFGITMCGKAVDYDTDRIFKNAPPSGEECAICKNMDGGAVIVNPNQENIF